MNTFKILLFISFIALSCSNANYQTVSSTEDNYEKELARQQRLDSLHKITVPETVQTQKITDPPKTVSKKVKRVDANN